MSQLLVWSSQMGVYNTLQAVSGHW